MFSWKKYNNFSQVRVLGTHTYILNRLFVNKNLGTIINGRSYDTSHFGFLFETFTPPCPRSTSGFFGKSKTWNANQIEKELTNHISIGTVHHV